MMVVDLSRHMNRILEINVEQGWVRVEAGVVKDQLNAALAPHGLSSIQSSEGIADTPISPVPTSSGSVPPAAGADAEIARLQAHVEDLRRENGMLWDQVRHEREARIREIELLNGMIQGMRR